MKFIDTEEQLEAIYGQPMQAAIAKVSRNLSPTYRRWIETSPFCVISTVGPGGTDASPRGDDGPVARILDDRHLAIPDWTGNNRIDTLRNLMHDKRAAVMFMVPGSANVVRVNGLARVTDDASFRETFARHNNAGILLPRTVMILQVIEVYMQCTRAIMRSHIWGNQTPPEGLPTQGEMLAAQSKDFEAVSYDEGWSKRGPANLW